VISDPFPVVRSNVLLEAQKRAPILMLAPKGYAQSRCHSYVDSRSLGGNTQYAVMIGGKNFVFLMVLGLH